MRVLFLISTLTNGGAERAISNITTHLPPTVEADILVNSVSPEDYPTDAHIISLNMEPRIHKSLWYQAVAFFKRLRRLRSLKKTGSYDACISFMDSANVANILSGNRYCKTIVSVRNDMEHAVLPEYRYIVSPLIRLFYGKADKIVALSNGVKDSLIRHFHLPEEKVCTILNGFDLQAIQLQAEAPLSSPFREWIKPEDFVFLTMGRMNEQKAQWHLIRSFRKVKAACPEGKLIIMGRGNLQPYLNQLIEEMNLQDSVLLAPFQSNPFSLLDASDVFVFPSLFEGFGNALCEAITCGKPCISAFHAGAREILAPTLEGSAVQGITYAQYGVITPVCSGRHYEASDPLEPQEEMLADAMIALAKDPALRERYQQAAKLRANAFSIEQTVQQWLALVRES